MNWELRINVAQPNFPVPPAFPLTSGASHSKHLTPLSTPKLGEASINLSKKQQKVIPFVLSTT